MPTPTIHRYPTPDDAKRELEELYTRVGGPEAVKELEENAHAWTLTEKEHHLWSQISTLRWLLEHDW